MGEPIFSVLLRRVKDASRSAWRWVCSVDRWLLGALAVGMLLGVQGLGWGRYDCLNLDRLAFQTVMSEERRPFEPARFVKPPLYTYLNLFLARWPAEFLVRQVPGMTKSERRAWTRETRVVFARFWNLAMFAGMIALTYGVTCAAFGQASARASSWILATSAGFVPYKIFLTTDLALLFFMLAAFAASVRILKHPGIGISIVAGLLAGAAGAIKYNGIAIAVCLPLAHLLASRGNPILACLRRPAAWLCGLAVPVGFIIGNPYSVIDFPKFWEGFYYNYTVTPVYNGAGEGTGYVEFVRRFVEIFGWPGSLLLGGMALIGLVPVIRSLREPESNTWKVWLLAAVAFALYFWKIGAFPRMETRFVLPTAPFLLILAAAGLGAFFRWKWLAVPVLAVLLLYNVVCSWQTAELFRLDPRTRALAWADQNLKGQATLESSGSCPQWQYLPGREFRIHRIPTGLERKQNFAELFADDPDMLSRVSRFESREDLTWFSPEARARRDPQWIAWSSIDLEGIARPFYEALSQPGSGYRVVFNESSPSIPRWSYPRYTEFLRNQLVIWEKNPQPGS
ncbi:MAG: glycosyltransferase family 39 protein [Terrimicrobiaceae bacterium]|nr:glycosyltransferase family 39 protein [Terrimicrobiaceae bacterium]